MNEDVTDTARLGIIFLRNNNHIFKSWNNHFEKKIYHTIFILFQDPLVWYL